MAMSRCGPTSGLRAAASVADRGQESVANGDGGLVLGRQWAVAGYAASGSAR